jgi:TM2 domain-containing membrane protein YozV
MDCVNHSGVPATAYCQTCGKALCAGCVRSAAGGQILCEPCLTGWQAYQQPYAAPSSGPNPAAAAVLGLIPGVGAMYNGQFFKGLIHVVIFAVLVSVTHHYGIFGLFIAAWVLYQSFEAYHTAIALRDGLPPPDPLGLNEVGNWLNLGSHHRYPGPPPAPQPGSGPAQPNPSPGAYAPGPAAGQPSADPTAAGYQPPYTEPFTPPYQGPYHGTPYQQPPYQPPYTPPAPGPGFTPDPSAYWQPMWRRKEPIGAVVLIALGLLFLLGQLDIFHGRLIEFSWPLLLICLGVWLIVRRLGDSHGGSK